MSRMLNITALIQREGDAYVSLCPEFDVASQGGTVEEARGNLIEAVTLFLEEASDQEVQERFHPETYVTGVQISVG